MLFNMVHYLMLILWNKEKEETLLNEKIQNLHSKIYDWQIWRR